MRIAIFSDIHANLNGLNAVLDDISRRGGADVLVAAGDLVTDGPRPVETFERLLEANCRLIRGNHDEYLLGRGLDMIRPEKREAVWKQTLWAAHKLGPERLSILEQHPFELTFSPSDGTTGHDLMVVHANLKNVHGYTGHLEQDEKVLEELYGEAPPNVRVIAFGHWHMSSIRHWRGLKLVNVASVAYPKDKAHLAGYTIFDWDRRSRHWQIEQHRVSFNWHEEVECLYSCGMPGDTAHLASFYGVQEQETAVMLAS
ncbi:MAG TPA: metallophosphoesterase [Chloroflexia bacterium]|nr:metallophosphoesterase [Chloroflexia bacterium]